MTTIDNTAERFNQVMNSAVPKPKPPCPRCRGTGKYHEPPLAVQEQQFERGERGCIVQRCCPCIRGD